MEHTQEYLNSLTKAERGELWIQGVLAKQPDYNVQDLKDIWSQTENTHETYEQEADKLKWLSDELDEALQGEPIRYNSIDEMWADIEQLGEKILQERKNKSYKIA